MIYIDRLEEPEFWTEFCKNHPEIHYDDLQKTEEGKDLRRKIRTYNMAQQHGLCAYCCKSINIDNSLNEHIKPRGVGQYSNLSMKYSNLIVSCISEGDNATCSSAKGNQYTEKFISPLDKDCESHFAYSPNGEVFSETAEGIYTINVLNLNSYRLRKARMAFYQACEEYHNDEMVKEIFLKPDENDQLQPHADFVKFFFG